MTIGSGNTVLAADLFDNFAVGDMKTAAEDGRKDHHIDAHAFAVASTTDLHKRSRLFRPNDDMEIMSLWIVDHGHSAATSRTVKAALKVNNGDTKLILDDDMSVSNTDATTGRTQSVLDLTATNAAKKNWVLKGVLYRLEVEVVTTSFTHDHLQAILHLRTRQRR